MPIQYVYYGKFKDDEKGMAEVNWWRDENNVRRFKEALTEGATYMGYFLVINGTASHDYELWLEFENWGVLDKSRDNPKMKALQREIYEQLGVTVDWYKTKALRTPSDARHIIKDD